MLKYTPIGHPDRFPLQMALTRLEFVASTLNERKRSIESRLAIRDLEKRMTNLEEVWTFETALYFHAIFCCLTVSSGTWERLCSVRLSAAAGNHLQVNLTYMRPSCVSVWVQCVDGHTVGSSNTDPNCVYS